MKARNYSEPTRKALFALSLGRCYEPDCQEQVVRMASDGTAVVLAEISHICAAQKGGPRYDASMTDDDRRAFPNLLLLCTYHHKLVDGEVTSIQYSVETLTDWKTAREGQMAVDLQGLTEDGLEDLLGSTLNDIIGETKVELTKAINDVEQVSRESANLLRVLVDETFKRPHLDAESVVSLAHSANALQGMMDYVPMLERSSSSLDALRDYVVLLQQSSQELNSMSDWVASLGTATENISHLQDYVTSLEQSCKVLNEIPDHAELSQSAAEAVEEAADQLRQARNDFETLRQGGYEAKFSNAAQDVAKAALSIQHAADYAADGAIPDRLTYVFRGFIGGLVAAGVTALVIWSLVSP
ncbi:hypothetical protein [Actinoalloteichus caeruleus]|uniref:hypothetical protein n=1 Tax=Actinoalloteichus cyanogriseus TaxID=2893586 RepID=UPI003BB98035